MDGVRNLHAESNLRQPTDELLIDRYVVEGDPRFARFRRTRCTTRFSTTSTTSVMALLHSCGDSDWVRKLAEQLRMISRTGALSVPHRASQAPLRVSVQREDGSYDAFQVRCFDRLDSTVLQLGVPDTDTDTYMGELHDTVPWTGWNGWALPVCDCSASGVPDGFDLGGEPNYPTLGGACRPS